MSRYFLLAVIIVSLSGCASNPYKKFYHSAPAEVLQTVTQRRAQVAPAVPELFQGNNPQDDLNSLAAEGYVVIGQSSFNGPRLDADQALEQGKRVGADRVIVYGHLASVEHASIPVTLPTSQTSVTNVNATAFGPAGTANVYGTGTTTIYGTRAC